jgi:hypothetical protein
MNKESLLSRGELQLRPTSLQPDDLCGIERDLLLLRLGTTSGTGLVYIRLESRHVRWWDIYMGNRGSEFAVNAHIEGRKDTYERVKHIVMPRYPSSIPCG